MVIPFSNRAFSLRGERVYVVARPGLVAQSELHVVAMVLVLSVNDERIRQLALDRRVLWLATAIDARSAADVDAGSIKDVNGDSIFDGVTVESYQIWGPFGQM